MKKLITLFMSLVVVCGSISACISCVPVKSGVAVNSYRKQHKKPKRKVVIVGSRVKVRPVHSVIVNFKNNPYLYADGVFYREIQDSEYEVVCPEIGMIVPELPQYNVRTMVVNGKTLFVYDDYLYKEVVTTAGTQYEIVGNIK